MDEEELKKQQDEEQDQMLIQDLGLPPQIYYDTPQDDHIDRITDCSTRYGQAPAVCTRVRLAKGGWTGEAVRLAAKAELKEAFLLFDKTGEGVLTPEDAGNVLRAIGQNPSAEDVMECQQRFSPDEKGNIPYVEFMRGVRHYRYRSEEEQEEDLAQAFAVFDRDGDSRIDPQELKDTLLSLGEKMSEEEVEDLFSLVENIKKDKILYKEFVRPLTQVTPPKTATSSQQHTCQTITPSNA